MTKKTVLTGDRPTGKLHLGHFVGSIENRIKLQDQYNQVFYMIADTQALTDNFDNPQKVHENVFEVALDNLACGVDPDKTIFFIQSQIPELAELTMYFLNLTTIQKLSQNPTIKLEVKEKGWKELQSHNRFLKQEGIPAGFFCYPVSQAADILAFKADIIPVGDDQKPHIEQANEILRKFNSIYGEIFNEIKIELSTTPRLLGIDGKAKASKSLNNAIFLSDTDADIEDKVSKMFTAMREGINSPGTLEGNVVFHYLDIFDKNKDELQILKDRYVRGDNIGDKELKNRLANILKEFVSPIREKREKLASDPSYVWELLEKGTNRAKIEAKKTLDEVREAMKLKYF